MKTIQLTKGYVALVDDEDYEELNKFKWKVRISKNTIYAVRHIEIPMHRIIVNAKEGEVVDHINRNGADNQKKNLRICTHTQNRYNSVRKSTGTSKYKGVDWNKQHKTWRARININHKPTHIGYFKDEIEAAKAYDVKAKEYFGEFAYLNFE